jgi:hypothetical protein
MSGWKPCLLALGLSAGLGTAAAAQGVVPGGWAPQFSYQTFAAPGGVGGGYVGYGYGMGYGNVPNAAGFAPYGYGAAGFAPYRAGSNPPIYRYTPSSQAVNAVDPLIGAIRRSTGRKGK